MTRRAPTDDEILIILDRCGEHRSAADGHLAYDPPSMRRARVFQNDIQTLRAMWRHTLSEPVPERLLEAVRMALLAEPERSAA